ncbi:uncharacterized protein METZ01_LOCUS465048, partial [marine metagenome]
MSNFFSLESFEAFSFGHIAILGIFLAITIGIGFLGNRFKNNHKTTILITKILIGITIFQEIFDYLNRYLNGTIYLWQDLPLHICNYVLFISVIALYNRNEYLFNFCYFNAFSAALLANLTPDLNGVTGDIGVFFFFLHHFLIIINVVWMIVAFDMKPSIKGVFSTVILLNVFAVPIGLINILIYKLGFGFANYMYLRQPPDVNNPLLIGEGGRY